MNPRPTDYSRGMRILKSPRFRLDAALAASALAALLIAGPAVATEPAGPTAEADARAAVGATQATPAVEQPVATADALPAFSLKIKDAYVYKKRKYALPRARLKIRGEVAAPLDGQKLTVKISKNGAVVDKREVTLKQHDGRSSFEIHFRTGRTGRYLVETELSPEMAAVVAAAEGKRVAVVRTNLHRGEKSVAVRVFQSKLAKLKYVVPRDGRFDAATGRALMAFRKVTRMARNESAGYVVARKLAAGKGSFKLRRPGAGRHVEVDIGRQVMAFAERGKVVRIYHVSTGAPGTPTVRGTFYVYRKDWGTNAKGMVHSSYFIRGYAIHGFASVPPYNASHGCVRVPVPNAASISNWVRMGTRVDTY